MMTKAKYNLPVIHIYFSLTVPLYFFFFHPQADLLFSSGCYGSVKCMYFFYHLFVILTSFQRRAGPGSSVVFQDFRLKMGGINYGF